MRVFMSLLLLGQLLMLLAGFRAAAAAASPNASEGCTSRLELREAPQVTYTFQQQIERRDPDLVVPLGLLVAVLHCQRSTAPFEPRPLPADR